MTSSTNWDSGTEVPITDSLGQYTTEKPRGGGGEASGGAKDRAQTAATTAKDEGAHVADTATTEVKKVAGEAKDKAADLVAEAKSQLGDQSKSQLQYLVTKLEELTSEVDSMVEGSDVQGTVTELARQFSDKTRALSSHLTNREPQDLLDDVRVFARRRPGTFIVGAVAAGVVAGRLTRGVKQAHDDETVSSGAPQATPRSESGIGTPQTADLFGSPAHESAGSVSGVPSSQNSGEWP